MPTPLFVLFGLLGIPGLGGHAKVLVAPLAEYASTPADTLSVVRVNGVERHYHESGSGEPIVFVPGGLVDLREWVPVARELGDAYRTIGYSRRGRPGRGAGR